VVWNAGEYEEANEIAQRMLKLAPDDLRAWILLGNTYQTLAKFQEACDAYQKVLQLDPNNFDAFSNIA
jgi:cytochrome c-type biogenesis protein CcmH/NrfG